MQGRCDDVAMRLNESVRYDGATPQQVFGLICAEDFRGEVCEKMHAISHGVTVERVGDTATVTISRVMPADLPDFIKKFSGKTVEIVQTERWGPADAEGARTGRIEVQITNQPVSVTGSTALHAADAGDGVVLALDAQVTVKVPFLGNRIEPEIAEAVVSALQAEATEGTARLAR